jgi:very-short-patch-repair endonuclease
MQRIRRTARRLRRDSTLAEHKLWQALRNDALGVPFRRQHPIPPYIADFAAPSLGLIVEVDGGQHAGDADAERDAALAAAGWRILRLWNNDVVGNLTGVLHRVGEVIAEQRGKGPHPGPPPLRGRGSGSASG